MVMLKSHLRRARTFFTVAISLLGGACCRVPELPAHFEAGGQPVWTVSVVPTQDKHKAEFDVRRQIAFASDGELVTISDDGPSGQLVGATVIAARDGRVVRKVAWESKHPNYVFATAGGQYAVVSDGATTLYSGSLDHVVKRVNTEVGYQSPDRRVLARTEFRNGEHSVSLFDASTIAPLRVGFRGQYLWSFTDRWIAEIVYAKNHHAVVRLTSPDAHQVEWESGCKAGLGQEVRPQFVSADLIAAVGCNRLDVITTAGGLVFSAELAADYAHVAAVSPTGARFAIVQAFLRRGDPSTLCVERIVVFDVNQHKAIFMTDVSDLAGTTGGASGLAFSPSGAYLAVNSAGTVRMFALLPTS